MGWGTDIGVAAPGFEARPSSRAISSRRRRISSNPASVSKMEVLVMDHLYGSWGWFDCAGLGSSLTGSVLFRALAGHPRRPSTETGPWRRVNTGTRRSHITGAEVGT